MESRTPAWDQHSVDIADDEYRRVCLSAVLAFLLGLVSVGAFFNPLLLVVPLAGLGVGLVALAKISASAGHLSGQSLARWGIALTIIFGVGGTVHPMIYSHLIIKQGTAFATQWLEMLAEGDSKQALALIDNKAKMRMAPVDSHGQPALNEHIEEDILRHFQQDQLVNRMIGVGNSGVDSRARDNGPVISMFDLGFPPRINSYNTTLGLVMLVHGRSSQAMVDVPLGGEADTSGSDLYVYLELQKDRFSREGLATWSVSLWKSAETLVKLAATP